MNATALPLILFLAAIPMVVALGIAYVREVRKSGQAQS